MSITWGKKQAQFIASPSLYIGISIVYSRGIFHTDKHDSAVFAWLVSSFHLCAHDGYSDHMNLQSKTTLLTAFLSLAMVTLIALGSLFFFRQFSLYTASEHIRSVAEVVRVSLTESMINNVIRDRQQFMRRLTDVPGLLMVRVVRGPEVDKQFGAGLAMEQAADEIERQVLSSGVSDFRIAGETKTPVFRGTVAFIARLEGEPNCLSCHQVADGAVLGAVTVELSLAAMQSKAITTIAVMVGVMAVFGVIFTLLFRWQLSRMVLTARGVQKVVAHARGGDFSGRLDYHGNDEIGQIASDLNSLMGHLQRDLGTINRDIARLLNYELQGNTNMITTTTEMVEVLLEVAQFKQSVEEDHSVQDVYMRIGRILMDQFWIQHFSIYEATPSTNHMRPVLVDGENLAECRWCHDRVLVRADACRAQRTGHIVHSFQDAFICPCFARERAGENIGHLCIPIIHSGVVGNVVQIVIDQNHGHLYQVLLPFIQVFLRESASTVEAKRLLDTLRESSLRDPLTTLHNRRFLEEYVVTLDSTTKRGKTQLAVLLMDLDHFKEVNDTWGHEAGDNVLKAFAKILHAQVVRSSDLVIRFGGEEFLVVLQGNDAAFGAAMAERIRLSVENLRIPTNGVILRRTVSIGVACFPDDGDSINDVIKRADLALYQAKEGGRNRVVVYQVEELPNTQAKLVYVPAEE
jgi:diguanylate cyclase (GGDEF)-like protein